MKKTYSAPTAQALQLHLESAMLTGSDTKNVEKTDSEVGADASLSNDRAWNTSIWTRSDED